METSHALAIGLDVIQTSHSYGDLMILMKAIELKQSCNGSRGGMLPKRPRPRDQGSATKVIVDAFQNFAYVNHIISPILDDCRHLMIRFQQVQLKHCYLVYILFSSPPVDLVKALEDDCNGVFFNRLCTELDVMF
ncbi:hypothetical protein ACB092_06G234500 [Castanea dentata]